MLSTLQKWGLTTKCSLVLEHAYAEIQAQIHSLTRLMYTVTFFMISIWKTWKEMERNCCLSPINMTTVPNPQCWRLNKNIYHNWSERVTNKKASLHEEGETRKQIFFPHLSIRKPFITWDRGSSYKQIEKEGHT